MGKKRDLELQLGRRHARLHIILVWLFSSIMVTVGLLGASADKHVPVFLLVITLIALLCLLIIYTPVLKKLMIRVGERLIED